MVIDLVDMNFVAPGKARAAKDLLVLGFWMRYLPFTVQTAGSTFDLAARSRRSISVVQSRPT